MTYDWTGQRTRRVRMLRLTMIFAAILATIPAYWLFI